jgi:aminoglycoside phosphotransferase (APT) family kinase protein
MPIPVEVEELTAEWFTEVLQARAPGAVVTGAEVVDTSSGTTGRARVRLVSTDEQIPDTVFVKLPPFTPDRRAMVNMVGMGVAEARFYEEVAPWLPVRTPAVLHAAHDTADDGYIMVFEDLSSAGATQPTQEEGDAADFAAQVMESMASFHAHMHGSPRLAAGGDLQWIADRTHGYGSDEGMAIMRMGIADFGDEMPPVFHELAEIYLTQGVRFNEVLFEGPLTLAHGDSHIGNMLRDGQGPILLDWAMVSRAPGLRDVAYFVGNSIPHEVRQHHERDLLRHYLDALAAHGVEIGWDEAWDTYRLQMITGWIAAASTAAMGDTLQPLEIGMRATERSNQALEELEVVPLLRRKLG